MAKLIYCPIVAATALLAGCATPQTQVRTGLTRAGLSPPVAGCMAEHMVDRLSLLQLRRLGRLSGLTANDPRSTSLDQYLRQARALGDPEIVSVTATAAGMCLFRR